MSQPTDPTTPGPEAAPPASAPAPAPAAPPAAAPPAAAVGTVPPPQPVPPGPTPPPPPAGGKLKPPVVIGAIVGAVALVGGGFALLGGSKDSSAAERPETEVTLPPGIDPLDPSVGPQVDDPVTSTTVPGLDLDEVVVTTTTSMPPPTTTVPVGPEQGSVPVGGGASVTPAAGWAVGGQQAGFVHLTREDGGADAFAWLDESGALSDPDEVMVSYLNSQIAPYVAELEVSAIAPQTVSGNVVGAASMAYRGVLATQSGGAVPIEGWVLVMVRHDGSVAIWEELNEAGSYEAVEDDLVAMLNSFIRTL